MAVPFSVTLRLRSLGSTALASAGSLAAYAVNPLGMKLRALALRVPFEPSV